MGSEPTAAGGGRKEASEWPRSADDEAVLTARNMPGTATGNRWTLQDDPGDCHTSDIGHWFAMTK